MATLIKVSDRFLNLDHVRTVQDLAPSMSKTSSSSTSGAASTNR